MMMEEFRDSQETLILGERPVTDSDVEAASPTKKKAKVSNTAVTDSEVEDGGSDCKSATLCAIPKEPYVEKSLKFAEVFSGQGILAKHMRRLGMSATEIDFLIGGEYHDISDYATEPLLSIETQVVNFSWFGLGLVLEFSRFTPILNKGFKNHAQKG